MDRETFFLMIVKFHKISQMSHQMFHMGHFQWDKMAYAFWNIPARTDIKLGLCHHPRKEKWKKVLTSALSLFFCLKDKQKVLEASFFLSLAFFLPAARARLHWQCVWLIFVSLAYIPGPGGARGKGSYTVSVQQCMSVCTRMRTCVYVISSEEINLMMMIAFITFKVV